MDDRWVSFPGRQMPMLLFMSHLSSSRITFPTFNVTTYPTRMSRILTRWQASRWLKGLCRRIQCSCWWCYVTGHLKVPCDFEQKTQPFTVLQGQAFCLLIWITNFHKVHVYKVIYRDYGQRLQVGLWLSLSASAVWRGLERLVLMMWLFEQIFFPRNINNTSTRTLHNPISQWQIIIIAEAFFSYSLSWQSQTNTKVTEEVTPTNIWSSFAQSETISLRKNLSLTVCVFSVVSAVWLTNIKDVLIPL